MNKWTIYYDDQTTYSNEDGDACLSPNKGVICINDNHHTTPLENSDWYFYHVVDGWYGVNIHQLLRSICNDKTKSIESVRQGSLVSNKLYKLILKRATDEKK